MRKRWTSEQLVETFTLTEAEQQHLSGMVSHNQLGFVVLLKFFTFEGHFPQSPLEVPKAVVEYLASQLSLPAEMLKQYQFDGRVITRHRRRIRQLLGFRPYALSDRQSIIDWLCQKILLEKQQPKALEPVVIDYLKTNRIEPPSPSQIQRLIDSAQNTYEADLFLTISTDLPASTTIDAP